MRILVYFITLILYFLCKRSGVHLEKAIGIPKEPTKTDPKHILLFFSWYSYYVGEFEAHYNQENSKALQSLTLSMEGYEIGPEDDVAL